MSIVEVAADAELLQLNFVGTEEFAGAANGVIGRMIEIGDIVRVDTDFRSEEFRVPVNVFGAGVAVQPGPIRIGEGFDDGRLTVAATAFAAVVDPV